MSTNQEYEKNYFPVTDLACCTALISNGHKLLALKRNDYSRRVQFLFELDSTIENTEAKFWNDELLVNPRTYFDNLKAVKSRIYSG
ncbi:MAG TPA: DUF5659 domain-containing protein [Candidatus Saccharimonadales bacterium]|nr:DUF5659 domain-containing protein [Candidatus Saccharimonadales bacterium]